MPETSYEQHVFGLELQDKFLGPLAKSAKLLEKNAAAWDKFEARVRGGGMDKAIAKVNGLIGRYEKLETVIKRIGTVKVSVAGGGGGDAVEGGAGDGGRVYLVVGLHLRPLHTGGGVRVG